MADNGSSNFGAYANMLSGAVSGQSGALGSIPFKGASSGKSEKSPLLEQVWMGSRAPSQKFTFSPRDGGGSASVKGGLTGANISQAELEPYLWLSKDKAKLQNAYALASKATGTEITSFAQFLPAWKAAVGAANESWVATEGGAKGSPLTPWDVFDLMKREGPGGAAAAGPHTATNVSRTINKLSDGGAWAVLKTAATQALGRAPTHEELRTFAAKANSIAVNNPDVVRSTTTTQPTGDSSTSSTRTQGATIDDFQMAAEKKLDTPESGAYQAATQYFNAMLQGLNSVV